MKAVEFTKGSRSYEIQKKEDGRFFVFSCLKGWESARHDSIARGFKVFFDVHEMRKNYKSFPLSVWAEVLALEPV